MIKIEFNSLKILPIDFWSFYSTEKDYILPIKFSISQCIGDTVCEYIFQEINEVKDDTFLAIDMNNISAYPNRMFSKINCNSCNVFFYNVNDEKLKMRMEEDLPDLIWPNDSTAVFSTDKWEEIERMIISECNASRKYMQAEIIKKNMLRNDGYIYFLESSRLYSNCYLSIKSLFREVEEFYFVIFSLAQMIASFKEGFDAFVTSSKNGAIIAAVLGDVLNIKEIHILGIGPKYSMELGDSVDNIKPGKRYIYVFDFMCTGSELKIVSTLLNTKKGILKGAIGISRYKEDQLGIPWGINVLVEEKELGIDYYIAGSEEDIRILEAGRNNE